jgi:serine/threonine-protein kinase
LCRQGFEYDFVKILDFGVMKHQTDLELRDELSLTRDRIAGTPSFMAPEIVLGNKPVDGRADLYALACVAYWLLTGQRVFEEESANAMMVAHVKNAPQPPSRRTELAVPPALDEIVLACLAKEPSKRPASAETLVERLARIELERPWTRERAAGWWETNQPRSAKKHSLE